MARNHLEGKAQATLVDGDAPMVVECLARAELAHRPMHEARHTAITDFLRETGNLKLAQMLAGHADIATTANITDLETALKALEDEA